jgi:NAD(P)-dependent dehydrogenase (short-subunit alcohol dehydrogenase family)
MVIHRSNRRVVDVHGKQVVVTGGVGGLGGAIVAALAAGGAVVYALDLPPALTGAKRSGIREIAVDVSDEGDVVRALARVGTHTDGLDAMVVATGVQMHGRDGRIGDVTLEVWEENQRVNLTGTFLPVKHAIRMMTRRQRSSLVLIGSPTGLTMSGAGYSAYAASKAGMMALARVVAADYAGQGVRANVVVPGTMRTPLIEPLLADPLRRGELLTGLPIGRLGEPDDLTEIVRWLVSDASSFATGGFFPVDGGLTAR